MAIYHFSVKAISRADGRSAVACSAYRSGELLIDERQGKEQDYTKKTGIEYKNIYAQENAKKELLQRNSLWNKVEQIENRKNSVLAREFEIAFPQEFNKEQRQKLLNDFCKMIVERHNVVVDACIHAPHTKSGSDERNYHAHIMFTSRQLDKETGDFAKNKFRDFNKELSSLTVTTWRKDFADLTNQHLDINGFSERVDHRSYQEQNIELEATQHEGAKVTQLRRRGVFTEISLKNDEIKLRNLEIKKVIALDENINVSQNIVQQVQSEIEFQNTKSKYLEKTSLKISQFQNEELSKLTTELNAMSYEISELHKKEPLFFKTKWLTQINEQINQYNTKLEFQKHIFDLNQTGKKERYSEQLNTWEKENHLLEPKRFFESVNEKQLFVKQQKVNDEILNIDHQISEILCRQEEYRDYITNQRLEIIDSYIYEEDNYGNQYFSPKNGEKQKRLYEKEMKEKKSRDFYANFRRKIGQEIEEKFDKKIALQQQAADQKARELKEQLRKEREQQEQKQQKYLDISNRQKLQKQQEIEPKNPNNGNDNDYSPW